MNFYNPTHNARLQIRNMEEDMVANMEVDIVGDMEVGGYGHQLLRAPNFFKTTLIYGLAHLLTFAILFNLNKMYGK